MANDIGDKLIEDADLVLEYAARAGKLVDDALPRAVRDAKASVAEERVPDVVALSRALNAAVIGIAPVTLIDLQSGRSPFDQGRSPSIRKLQYALCGLAVVLSFFIAFYSHYLHRKEGAVREYLEIQAAKIPDKFAALRRLVNQDKVLTSKDHRLYEDYVSTVQTLKDLHARMIGNHYTLQELKDAPHFPFQRKLERFLVWIGRVTGFVQQPSPTDESRLQTVSAEDACKAPPATSDNPTEHQRIVAEKWDEFCLSETLGISFATTTNYIPFAATVSGIRDSIVLYSTWILPFLTGLLGAAVFLLRDSLNPFTASFGATRAVVRLGIGAVSGIIIGWFWSPSNLTGTVLAGVSSMPLVLAFLAGYSIDILFFSLERVRSALTAPQDRGKGNVAPG
jgi:hypothetical protein